MLSNKQNLSTFAQVFWLMDLNSMKEVDYIIVGDGFAGYFFAHQLILNKKSFVLFGAGKEGASKISAGVVNPVVLKKFTTFWLAQEQILYLRQMMEEIETYTGRNYLISEPIGRILHDETERKLWTAKAQTETLKPFLDPDFHHSEVLLNPFGTGRVLQSARIDVAGFFEDLTAYFSQNDILRNQTFEYEKLSANAYKNYTFKNIIFCEGMGVLENPFFAHLPLEPNKGHHLKVSLSKELREKSTFKKKHFLFSINDDLHYYGGTYDRDSLDAKIDDTAVAQLQNGLAEFYPFPFEVKEVKYGFRPTVKDRRPLLGAHPRFSNFFVFNGLGARGILNGSYFSKVLYEHIEEGKNLPAEVDVRRFRK